LKLLSSYKLIALLFFTFFSFDAYSQNTELTTFEGDLSRRAALGFITGSTGTENIFDAHQLEVKKIDSASASFRSGLRAGDIITAINSISVRSAIEGYEQLGNLPGKTKTVLTVRRDQSRLKIIFTPGSVPLEGLHNVRTTYGVLTTGDGTKLRTLITKPLNTEGKLPAILLSDWTSCGSVEVPYHINRGWINLVRGIVKHSGMIVMRVDKPGVGDSQGSCSELDFDETIAYQKKALKELKSRPDVDTNHIFIFGESAGSFMAPIVAQGEEVAGIFVYGGGATTWFERMVIFERKQRELSGKSLEEIDTDMKEIIRFFHYYLIESMSLDAIFELDSKLKRVWDEKISHNSNSKHFGRPIAFHQQAQKHDFANAWIEADTPVLALMGEYDQFESVEGAQSIVNMVNSVRPGTAKLIVYHNLNHQLELYSSPQKAMQGSPDPVSGAQLVVQDILNWLNMIVSDNS